jgi:hypothetical protein
VAPQNTTTDAQGKASTHWTLGSSVGNNTVNAVVSGVGTATFTATATAGSVSASTSTVKVSPGSITAGASTSTITVRVKDANGSPISGTSVSVTASGNGNQIDPASATTDDNGVATFTFGSTVGDETKTITATAGGVTLDQKPTIRVEKAQSSTKITGHGVNPSPPGPVHVTFSVISIQGGGTPTGQVTVISEQQPGVSCTADVSAGACDITLTAAGDHHLIASYSGDARFAGSNDDDHHQILYVAPVANPDAYSTPPSTTLNVAAPVGVLANDSDANGDHLTAQLVNTPTQGVVVLNPDGSFIYTPNFGAAGTDSFTYTASDGSSTSPPATVTITFSG